MILPSVFDSMEVLLKDKHISEILKINEKFSEKGLNLTKGEALEIIETRSRLIKNYERIVIDNEATKFLIEEFGNSSFITRENYVSTINELQEVFYYIKNENGEKLSDNKLIIALKRIYEDVCKGSLELLRGKGVEEFLKEFKTNSLKEENLMTSGDLDD